MANIPYSEQLFPIFKFTSNEQLQECLEYWQSVLYLNDWAITARYHGTLKSAEKVMDSHLDSDGRVSYYFMDQNGIIDINQYVIFDEKPEGCPTKDCAEQVLLHELIHLKVSEFDPQNEDEDECFRARHLHKFINQMSRTLICVKYGLDKDWWVKK